MFCQTLLAFSALLLPSSPVIPPHFPLLPQETTTSNKGHATVQLRTDVGWVGASQTFHVIVLITPDPDWHVYWKNPGANGAPTEIEIQAPEGFIVGEPIFPRPRTFKGEEGETYGYSELAAIFIPVTAPDSLHDGQVKIDVTTSWLACKKLCVMGEQHNTLDISTNALRQGPRNRDMQLSRWYSGLPLPLGDLDEGKSFISGRMIHISGKTEIRPIQFIGIEQRGVQFGSHHELVREGNSFRLSVPIQLNFSLKQQLDGDTIEVEGLLLLGRKNDDPSYVVQLEIDPTNQ